MFSYNNPSHRCAACGRQQTCCDGSGTELCSGPEQCDNYFIFCLRPLGTSDFDEQFCPLGRYSTTFILQNQDSFTFEEGEMVLNGHKSDRDRMLVGSGSVPATGWMPVGEKLRTTGQGVSKQVFLTFSKYSTKN